MHQYPSINIPVSISQYQYLSINNSISKHRYMSLSPVQSCNTLLCSGTMFDCSTQDWLQGDLHFSLHINQPRPLQDIYSLIPRPSLSLFLNYKAVYLQPG